MARTAINVNKQSVAQLLETGKVILRLLIIIQ